MKLSEQINFQDVGDLTRRLTARKITPPRFSLEIPCRDAANGIYAAMKAEVEYRNHDFLFDAQTREHIERAAEWIINPGGKSGLLLMGTYGNGKTSLMKAIARLISYVTEQTLGYSKRLEMPVMSAKSIARLCAGSESSVSIYEGLFTSRMLGVDDMGQEPKEVIRYGGLHTPLMDLISERYDRQLFTIITTNMNGKQIDEKYGGCIYDRLKEFMHIITFSNPSYRK